MCDFSDWSQHDKIRKNPLELGTHRYVHFGSETAHNFPLPENQVPSHTAGCRKVEILQSLYLAFILMLVIEAYG